MLTIAMLEISTFCIIFDNKIYIITCEKPFVSSFNNDIFLTNVLLVEENSIKTISLLCERKL